MRKSIRKIIALASTLAVLNPLSAFAQDKEVVTLWGEGSDNVKMAWESVQKAFNESEEYGDKYELKINWITSGSGAQGLRDRIIAAHKAGETDTDYDLIELGADNYAAYTAETEDIFQDIDFSKVPNYENLQAKVAAGEDQLVPYRGTTVVLAYDSERVKEVPTTAEELYQWIKDNPGRFAYNTPGSGGAGNSFVTTAVYNQIAAEALTSQDEKWMDEWTAGFDLLKELHASLYQSGGKVVYPHKNQGTLDLLANQQVDMIPAWADMAVSQINEGRLPETTKITQIDPSFTGNTTAFAMPTVGGQSEGAYAVMDFFISDEAQQILLDELAAIPLVDASKFESKNAELLSGLDVTNFRTSSLGELSNKLLEKWDAEIGTLE